MVLDVDDVCVGGREAGVHLQRLAQLVWRHVSVDGFSYSAASVAGVVPIVTVQTVALSGLAVSLHLLIDEILEVLLSYLSFLEFEFIGDDVLL